MKAKTCKIRVVAAAAAMAFILLFSFGCTTAGITGSSVKEGLQAGSGLEKQQPQENIASADEENQQGCIVDAGIPDNVFSGHGSL